ncbi:hypothetical protein ACFL08_04345 [Patescibacteria group bacterium]
MFKKERSLSFVLNLEAPFEVLNGQFPIENKRGVRATLLPGRCEMETIENPYNSKWVKWIVVRGTKLGMSDGAM